MVLAVNTTTGIIRMITGTNTIMNTNTIQTIKNTRMISITTTMSIMTTITAIISRNWVLPQKMDVKALSQAGCVLLTGIEADDIVF